MDYSEDDFRNLDKIINTLARTSIGTVPEILYGYQRFPAYGSPQDLESRTYEDVLIDKNICSITEYWTPNSVPGGYKTIYLASNGRQIQRSGKSIRDFLEEKKDDEKSTVVSSVPYKLSNNFLHMEKYEAYDLILDHILTTNQGHSGHIKHSLVAFKDADQARIDILLVEMYNLAPEFFEKKPFQGRPAIFKNNYTHLIKEEGGFKSILERKENKETSQKVVFQKNDLTSALANLHPKVQESASRLFKNGHFRQAIFDTYVALSIAVKDKSGLTGDNTPLMQSAFTPKNTVLRVSSDLDEQQGFMWLFSGAMMGIRNPLAHQLREHEDPQRTLELLSFASLLFRVLDDSQKT